MGKASRKKRERRVRRAIEQSLRDGMERSFSVNFSRAAASGRMRPVDLSEVIEDPDRFESVFVTREAWSSFVSRMRTQAIDFNPSQTKTSLRFGFLGTIGNCSMYTDAFSEKKDQILEQAVAVERKEA